MKTIHTIAAVVLVTLLAGTVYGVFRTEPPAVTLPNTPSEPTSTDAAAAPSQPTVDQTPLKTAQQLATLVTLPEVVLTGTVFRSHFAPLTASA